MGDKRWIKTNLQIARFSNCPLAWGVSWSRSVGLCVCPSNLWKTTFYSIFHCYTLFKSINKHSAWGQNKSDRNIRMVNDISMSDTADFSRGNFQSTFKRNATQRCVLFVHVSMPVQIRIIMPRFGGMETNPVRVTDWGVILTQWNWN